jgi:hypothetical protein
MLQNLSKDIRECYRRAEECRRSAETAMSELAKFDYLEMEQRWSGGLAKMMMAPKVS